MLKTTALRCATRPATLLLLGSTNGPHCSPPLQKRHFTSSLSERSRVSTFPWKSPCRHWPQWLVIFVSFARRQGGPGEVVMSKRIYVGNLPFSVSDDELRSLFGEHGTVEAVNLITDRDTGRPRGFGFVEMSSGADEAIPSAPPDGHGRPVAQRQRSAAASGTVESRQQPAGLVGGRRTRGRPDRRHRGLAARRPSGRLRP